MPPCPLASLGRSSPKAWDMQYCDTLLSDRAHETDVSSCGGGARAEEEGEESSNP